MNHPQFPTLLKPVEIPPDYEKVPPTERPKLDRQRLASKGDAMEFIDKHGARIQLVTEWLVSRGAPATPELRIEFSPNVGDPEQSYHNIRMAFTHKDETKEYDLVLTLWRPTITLTAIGQHFEIEVQATPKWKEPPPPPPPVQRPISEHIDQRDNECLLSRGYPYDRFEIGAKWTDPDGTIFVKERATNPLLGAEYHRWRKIHEPDTTEEALVRAVSQALGPGWELVRGGPASRS